MKTPQEIEKLTQQALSSLDNVKPVEANPYMYQKIKNRQLHRHRNEVAKTARLMLKLSAALVLFLGINLASYYVLNKPVTKQLNKPAKTGAAALSDEFFANGNSYSY